MLRQVAIFSATLLALIVGAEAQDGNIRELQYTEYLRSNDFNGDRVKNVCQPNNGLGIAFQASADEPNLLAFLEFLKIRPDRLSTFNGGQFSQIVTALGFAVQDVCEEMMRVGHEIEEEGEARTDFDPVIDVVNLSDFNFNYRFQHDHPQGHLPLHRRSFPIVELDVRYDDDNFPDEEGELWVYKTAELIVTVNNYDYFGWPESDAPDGLRRDNGSYPCYYKHPTLRAVYRYAWEDCNPETYAENAPSGRNLRDAVRLLAVDFIEQNVDTAPPRRRTSDDQPVDVCCRERGPIFGAKHYFTPLGECRDSASDRFSIVASRYCEPPEPDRPEPSTRRYDPVDRGRDVCCRNYASNTAPDIFASRRWCEDRDNHDIVPDHFCREHRRDAIVCCEDGRGIIPETFETTEAICLARDRHRVLYEGVCFE